MLPTICGSLTVLVPMAVAWVRRRFARRPSTSLLGLLLGCLRVRIATWLLPIPEARTRYEKFCQHAYDQFENRLLGLDQHGQRTEPATGSQLSTSNEVKNG